MTKNKTHRDLRLDETIGSVDATRLASTRKTIHDEIQHAQDRVAVASKEGTTLMSSKSVKVEDEAKVEDETTSPPESSAEDARLVKLDLITDIQLILVGRFQRLFTVLVITAIVMFLCLAALVVGVIAGFDMRSQVAKLVADQKSMLAKQEALVKSAEDTKKSVAETAVKVAQTKKKVDEAVEAAPKVEIDPDTGTVTKVIIPIKRYDPDAGDPKDKAHRPKHPKGDKPKTPKGVSLPLK